MITMDEMQRLLFSGGDVVGPDGKKIGGFGQLFLDAATGRPAWVTVTTGLFGSGESFVPLVGASMQGEDLAVAYDKGQVRHAPRIEGAEGHLSPDEERALYQHFGLLPDDDATTDGATTDDATDDPARHDEVRAGAPDGPDADLDRRAGEAAGPGGDDGTEPVFLAPPIRPIGTPAAPPGVSPLEPPGTPSATMGSADLGPGDRRGEAEPSSDELARGGDGTGVADAATTSEADPRVLRAERARVVGTETVPTERARMRRYTVTEESPGPVADDPTVRPHGRHRLDPDGRRGPDGTDREG